MYELILESANLNQFHIFISNFSIRFIFRLVFEFPPVGGIIPSHEIQAFKLLRYVQIHDYLILLLEIFLFLFLLYYSWEELHEWSSMRRRGYYWSLWCYVDWVILLVSHLDDSIFGKKKITSEAEKRKKKILLFLYNPFQ